MESTSEKSRLIREGQEDEANCRSYFRLLKLFPYLALLMIGLIHISESHRTHETSQRTSAPTVDFSHLSTHCAHIRPIQASSFIERQDALARTIHSLGASAYVAEPGPSAAYYANLSTSTWHLSERPLLLIVTPQADHHGMIHANMSILTPTFESTRAKLQPIPTRSYVTFTEWDEDASPYDVAVDTIAGLSSGTVYVDSSIRHFIVDGLQLAASQSKVIIAPTEIKRLRERKSREELEIMKCVNEVTVLAIRATRDAMYIGIRESEVRLLISSALHQAGLQNAGGLVLFGKNAALPHGSGTDRVLLKTDLILIDCGGSLYGYWSDVTRTFALESSEITQRHLQFWEIVYRAQSAAIRAAAEGIVTAEVDRVARETIWYEGYGSYFTHRLGHGIGLEEHESPYLRGGSNDIILTGHTFSDEPGIYLEGEVGIRLEDCFYIADDGSAIFLTEGVGGQAGSVWEP